MILSNHLKDLSNPKGHEFIQNAKFTLIEQLTKTENTSKATLNLRLKQREDFLILKLDTFTPEVLN